MVTALVGIPTEKFVLVAAVDVNGDAACYSLVVLVVSTLSELILARGVWCA
jgi:hypothetical protein